MGKTSGSGLGERRARGEFADAAPGALAPDVFAGDPFLDGKPSARRPHRRPAHLGRDARRAEVPATHAAHAAPTPAPASRTRRVPSLDGMRTLAILAVVAYHLGVPWLPSGHMGVVMFLVLTGYLVTGSLVRTFERKGSLGIADIGRFWLRRLKRLWPAMVAMVLLVALACIVCNHVLLTKMRPDVAPALLGFLNWSYIAGGQSYFAQIGSPSPLTHLWYIGIDAQMCIVLPLAVALCLRLRVGRVALRRGLLAAALVSAVLMGVLYDPLDDPSRVYYGTDTRAFSVLVGAWLALVWPLGGIPSARPDLWVEPRRTPGADGSSSALRATPLSQAVGFASLAALVSIMAFVPSSSPFFYYGGMVLVSLLTVGLMASIMVPGGVLGRLFSLKPVVWFGERSYGVYLWHYPVIHLLGAEAPAPWWLMLAAVALSVVLAELSWVLLEKPVSDGRALSSVKGLVGAVGDRRAPAPCDAVPAALCLAVLAAVGIGCAVVPETTLVPEEAIVSTGTSASAGMDLSQGRPGEGAADGSAAPTGAGGETPQLTEEQVAQPEQAPALPEGPFVLYAASSALEQGHYEPLLVGDSVPGDTPFYETFPNGLIDSYIGRRPDQAIAVFQDYLDQGVVGHVVVFAVFSNTVAYPGQLDQLVAMAGPEREVYLVATVNPDGFQEEANQYLRECADRYDNVHYVDWPATVAGNEGVYIYPDGTHLTPEGAPHYLDMIARAIGPTVVADGGRAEPAN